MQSLIEQIQSAFSDVPFPGELDLTDSSYGNEPELLRVEFRDKTDWTSLSTEFLNYAPGGFGSALSFFSDKAFRFYLAAYLIADIENRLEAIDPAHSLCSSVTPGGEKQKLAQIWGGGTMGDYARRKFSLFTPEQVIAIVEYLWWKLESVGGYDEVIEQALMHYWLPRSG